MEKILAIKTQLMQLRKESLTKTKNSGLPGFEP